jgi:hypothetical protein
MPVLSQDEQGLFGRIQRCILRCYRENKKIRTSEKKTLIHLQTFSMN